MSAVGHGEKMNADMIALQWRPTKMTKGDIYFMATFVESRYVYWTGIKSSMLKKMVCLT